MLDYVVRPTGFGVVRNSDGVSAPHLYVLLVGATPSYGEPHLCSPSDACPWCSIDGSFAVR